MNDVHMEHEVVTAKLAEMGCPYASTDERAAIWLEGARAGLLMMADASMKALGLELPEVRQ
jgi:ribosome modulation factor